MHVLYIGINVKLRALLKMATSLYKMQYALKTCEEHIEKELTIFCKSCKKKICSLCFRIYHKEHEWELISEMAKQMRKDLPGTCQKIKADDISQLRKQVNLFETLISSTDSDSKKAEDSLKKARLALIKDINELVDRKIDKNQKRTALTMREYRGKLDGLKKKLQYLEMMTSALGTETDTFSDHDIIEMEQEMMAELVKAKSYDSSGISHSTAFVPGEMNLKMISEMIGDIQQKSLERMSKFKASSFQVEHMEPISEDKAWILDIKEKLCLFSRNGEEMKPLHMPVVSFTVTVDGKIVIIKNEADNMFISIINENEKLISSIKVEPLYPICVKVNNNNELLVALMSGHDAFNAQPDDRCIVQRMTLSGEVLHTYEFTEDGKTKLFTFPTQITESKNSDVCVINVINECERELVVLHRDGRVRFRYGGKNIGSKGLHPCDVTCDNDCRIIISEFENDCIQILSPAGILITVLRTFDIAPMSVALTPNGENLWIGFEDGDIEIYK